MIPLPSLESICVLAAQIGISAMILIMQIKSTLPCLVSHFLKKVGFKSWDEGFWGDKDFLSMTREEWLDWSSTAAVTWVGETFLGLVNCPYCLNFHLTWTLTIVATVVTLDPWSLFLGPISFLVSHQALTNDRD